ncbi:hypothetical protein PV683_18545 [Streptomyces sp. AK08-01B]|nr:hypothetical protein [Streptomyces sp. AK08-01B]
MAAGRKRVEQRMREAEPVGVNPRRKDFTRHDPKATLAGPGPARPCATRAEANLAPFEHIDGF